MTWLLSLALALGLAWSGPADKAEAPAEAPVRVSVGVLPGPTVPVGAELVVEARLIEPEAVEVAIDYVDLVLPDGEVIAMHPSLAGRGRWSCHVTVRARWGYGRQDLWVFAVDALDREAGAAVTIEVIPATLALN